MYKSSKFTPFLRFINKTRRSWHKFIEKSAGDFKKIIAFYEFRHSLQILSTKSLLFFISEIYKVEKNILISTFRAEFQKKGSYIFIDKR